MDGGALVHPSIVAAPARPRVISPYDVALVSRSPGAPFSRVHVWKRSQHGVGRLLRN